MAIQWGSYGSTGSGLSYRVGVDLAIAYPGGSLDTTDTQATITGKVYVQMASGNTGYGINGRVEITGDHSQTTDGINWSVNSGGGTTQLLTFTDTVSLTYGSSQTYSVTARFRGVTTWNFTPSKKATITVPARPYYPPAAPTNAKVTRVSDTQQNITWTRNATTAAPYQKIEVRRREYFNGAWSSYTAIKTNVSGTATAYSDTSTRMGRRYQYAVRAVNSAGNSAWDYTGEVHTTPPAPTSAPVAVRQGTSTIVVTKPSIYSGATGWQVEHTPTPGSTAISSTIDSSVDTFSHSPATSSTHKYRVRAVMSTPVLYGGWSPYSTSVQLLSPPAAPTLLSPNGEVMPVGPNFAVRVYWQHNPTDSSPQTQYRLRRRIKGTSTWTEMVVQTGSNESGLLTGLANGNEYEWAVQTRGEHANFGPWSATATIITSTVPVATVVSPDGGTITLPSTTLNWAFYQADRRTQTAWQVQVQRLTGDWVTFLDHAGSGTATSWETPKVLQNGLDHRWRVRVQDTAGQWSEWSVWSDPFAVAYVTPDEPMAVGTWHDDGYVLLEIGTDSVGTGPATVSVEVDRAPSPDGPWTSIARDVPPGAEWSDWTAPLDATMHYRVTAVSDLPSTSSTTIEVTTPPTGWMYLSGGPDLAQTVRLDHRRSRSISTGRERAVHLYEGAESPTEVSGAAVAYTLSVTAVLDSLDDRLALQEVFALPGPHLFRDGDQNTVYGTLSQSNASPDHLGEIEFSIERSDPGTWEQRQAAALACQRDYIAEVEE